MTFIYTWRDVVLLVAVALPSAPERAETLRAMLAERGLPEPDGLDRLVEATEGRGEAALVNVAERLRDQTVDRVVEQLRRRREIEVTDG